MADKVRKKINEMIEDSDYLYKAFIYACEQQKSCISCPLDSCNNKRCFFTFLTVLKMFVNYLESEEKLKPYDENSFVKEIIKLYKETKGD